MAAPIVQRKYPAVYYMTDEELLKKYKKIFEKSKKAIVKAMKHDLFVTRDLTELNTFTVEQRRQITDSNNPLSKCVEMVGYLNDVDKCNKFVRVLFKQSKDEAEKIFPFVKDLPHNLCPPWDAYRSRLEPKKEQHPIRHVLVITQEELDYNDIDDCLKRDLGGKAVQESATWGEAKTWKVKRDGQSAFISLLRLWRLDQLSDAMKWYPARIVIMCMGCTDDSTPYLGSMGRLVHSGDCVLVGKMRCGLGEVGPHVNTNELKLWNLLEIDRTLSSPSQQCQWDMVGNRERETTTSEKMGVAVPRPLLCPLSLAPPTRPRLHFSSTLPPHNSNVVKWTQTFYYQMSRSCPRECNIYFSLAFLQSSSPVNYFGAVSELLWQIVQFWFFAGAEEGQR